MSKKALIVMAKRPIAGQTKTRLVPPLTMAEAAELYQYFLLDVLKLARSLANVTPIVAYTPADEETAAYFRKLAPDFGLIPQIGSTLGERLDEVLSACLARGYDQVAAMNSDSPTLPLAYLEEAFQRLDKSDTDVVLGPCEDGGYYLIGWKRRHERMVREVQMSTDHVLADTLRIAADEQLAVELLAPWFDVDDLADLERIRSGTNAGGGNDYHTRRFLTEKMSEHI